jgi:tape measure domain-containing protein
MARQINITYKADSREFDDRVKKSFDQGTSHVRQFKSAIDSSDQSVAVLRRSIEGLRSTLSSVGRNLTVGLTAPLTALAVAAVKTATDFDSLKRGLTAVSGSAAETEKQLIRLKEVAKLPGLGFREAIQGSINLQAAGFSAQRAEAALKAFGNALATVGKGKAELDGVILALTQIESKGKVSAEEINQLAERVPQIRQIMIRAFGTADTEVIQRAKITSRQFTDTIVNELAKLPQVTGGARNAFENLKDSIEQSLLPLGNRLLETILPAIDRLAPKVLGLLEGFGKLSSGTQDLVLGFGAAAIAAGPFIIALGNLTQAVVALNAASSTGLMARLLGGPVILSAAIVSAVGVQTYREATGNQSMIDTLGGPDQDRIARILKERGLSGADAWMRVAQELKDQGLISSLPRPTAGELVPGGNAAAVYQALGTRSRPAIDAVALAAQNAKKAARAGSTGITLPTLTADDLISSDEAFRTMIAESDVSARGELIAQGRLSRTALTLEYDTTSAERLRQGRLSRAALTEDFEQTQKRIEQQREALEKLKPVLSDGQRFMDGFRSAVISTGDAFERLGQNIANSFRDVGSLLSNLKNSILGFFNDLLGSSLQRVIGQVLSPIAAAFGGGGGLALAGAGGGNIFRTPSTFPQSVSSSAIQNLVAAATGGGSGAPPSTTATQQLQQVFSDIAGPAARPRTVTGSVAGAAATAGGFSLSALGRSIGAAAPFLGGTIGLGLGGQSRLGQVAGAVGGGVLGLGVGVATGAITNPAIISLFTNPFTIPLAAGLLVGSVFLGKAKQRRQDEELSGQYLTQALQAIDQLAAGVGSGSISGSEAKSIFDNQILGTFRQQISQLKTRSVVESRLTNQVNDLRKVYEARIPPLIAEQERRAADARRFAAIDSRLIPQFATGGISSGGLAILHDREMVLTPQHQSAIAARAGEDIFRSVGVPGVRPNADFDNGGIYSRSSSQGGAGPVVIDKLFISIDAEGIAIEGMSGRNGEQVIIKAIENVNLRKDRR